MYGHGGFTVQSVTIHRTGTRQVAHMSNTGCSNSAVRAYGSLNRERDLDAPRKRTN